ncbi:MAG: hypothetical protein GY822_13355 [Deltaproteobacteria bacterium]|nr:hypothetical protein [Deltaproteobacteria bacterium]
MSGAGGAVVGYVVHLGLKYGVEMLNPKIAFVVVTLLGANAVLSGCLPEEIRTFTVETDSDPVTVPAQPIVGQNPLAPEQVFPADFGSLLGDSLDQEFSTEGVQANAVESLKLTSMSVEVLEPTTPQGRIIRDLSFIESLTLSIGGDGVETKEVAFSEEGVFVSELIAYDFEMTGAELEEALAAGTLVMSAELNTADYPNFETNLVFHTELTVVVDPVGALQ